MKSYSKVDVGDLTEARLDANYYAPRFLKNELLLAQCGFPRSRVAAISDLCNCGATPVDVVYSNEGLGLVRTSDVRPNHFKADGILKTNDLSLSSLRESVIARPGDMLYTMSGTIGYACVIPENEPPVSFSNTIARVRLPDLSPNDSHYTAAFFNCHYGYEQSLRLVSGGIQGHVMPNPFKELLVVLPNSAAQKYIGDKVRQAERLRSWAKRRGTEIESLVSNDSMLAACGTTEKQHNRPQLDDLSHRLDPKYYGNLAVAVFRQAKALGKPLASLVTSISNGFEERVFFETGRDYITVTEVSSGRLDLNSAPKISPATEVPDKAKIHERCTLVVRTGSIGTAVKVDTRDRGAVISSHLIRLEFAEEATAAAVAAYLKSPAGKILQHKISYGAVQPQIGQDELLALPIPQFVLDAKDEILALISAQESAIRASKALTTTAKLLVEALIEGHLDESQLIAAEQTLQLGIDKLDRNILSRLKVDGVDGQGQALLADLDELYRLLAQAEEA